jgi:hypothetical protein
VDQTGRSGPAPDGPLFTDFLAKMNCTVLQDGGRCGPGLYRDWRVPTIAELQSIVDASVAGCGTGTLCIDPIFGPTAASAYWSSSSAADPAFAWDVIFGNGNTGLNVKTFVVVSARAVRGGS